MPCPFAFAAHLLLGSFGEAVALSATAPLERLTVLLQIQTPVDSDNKAQLSLLHQSTWDRMVSDRGVWSLWQGNVVSIIYTVLQKSLSTYLWDCLWKNNPKLFLATDNSSVSSPKQTATSDSSVINGDDSLAKDRTATVVAQTKANLLAGCISSVILYPLNFALTNIMAAGGPSKCPSNAILPLDGLGIQDCLIHSIRVGGIFCIYKGLTMALAGGLKYQVSYVVLQERLFLASKKGDRTNKSQKVGWATTAASFAKMQAVALVSCCIAFPLETMCRRLQVQDPAGDGFSTRLANEDLHLYGGIAPRLLKTFIYNSILGICYSEISQDFIRRVFMKLVH
ncbi:mitochondrial carrier protein [Nitzschia inconspicua]|uniref:Mitochondrial carrier protein n=1 Tax=Nitzschia inconspicua TaxID=303405 RepID=A0A9K3PAX3_9STRA|nr:mitochondrial carrier protein [Nitzschia inconspicua]